MVESRHKVRVVCDQQEIGDWIDYDIDTSMINAADSFRMSRPFDNASWRTLRRDARLRVFIDDAQIMDGFIDKRTKRGKDGVLEISGRDRAGRLAQESAPLINYQGLELTAAVLKLAQPWFNKVTLSDARNRKLRMGKSRRIPAETEPLVIRKTSTGAGRVHPGAMRAQVITDIVTQAGLIWWSSADGKELFVGRPNADQAPSFIVRKTNGGGGSSTCKDLVIDEDNGDRYSLIAVVGSGGGTDVDFGAATCSRRSYVTDNADNTVDGTGRDFQYRKFLLMPEKNFDSRADADRVAAQEQRRRDFKRTTYTAEMPYHGQWFGGASSTPTLFAPNTVASITDEEFDPPFEDDAMICGCQYKRSKDGETTTLTMVPVDTEIVL